MVTMFVVIAAVLALASLGWVLWPLLQGARLPGLVLIFSLGMASFLLYRLVGTPAALQADATQAVPAALEDAIAQLETELARNPNQPEGWALLGRSYAAQGKPEQARDALARALVFAPDQPDLLVEAAQARALAAPDNRFDPEAADLLQRALALQPGHQRAQWFLGIWHRQHERPAEAARAWEALLAMVEPATADSLRPQIDAARLAAGEPALPPTASSGEAMAGTQAPAAGASSTQVDAPLLTLTIDIAPSLTTQLASGDTLFVFARQPQGPPMPVAAKKLPARDFPLTVTLGDADSPMPTLKLSQVAQVQLVARISRSGDVSAQPGDLESQPQLTTVPAADPQHLQIDQVVEAR